MTDITDYFGDVRDFHEKFDLPRHPVTAPGLLPPDVFDFRLDFLQEELKEFNLGHEAEDLEKCADALADLVYVALGTAHMMGIPFDLVWREVQKKNMEKERATGADDPRSTRPHVLNVVKPAGWTPPDHRPALDKATRDHAFNFRNGGHQHES